MLSDSEGDKKVFEFACVFRCGLRHHIQCDQRVRLSACSLDLFSFNALSVSLSDFGGRRQQLILTSGAKGLLRRPGLDEVNPLLVIKFLGNWAIKGHVTNRPFRYSKASEEYLGANNSDSSLRSSPPSAFDQNYASDSGFERVAFQFKTYHSSRVNQEIHH